MGLTKIGQIEPTVYVCPDCDVNLEQRQVTLHQTEGERRRTVVTKAWCCPKCGAVYESKASA